MKQLYDMWMMWQSQREVTTHLANGVGIGRPLAPNRRECERERDVHDVDSPTRTSNVMWGQTGRESGQSNQSTARAGDQTGASVISESLRSADVNRPQPRNASAGQAVTGSLLASFGPRNLQLATGN